MIDISTTTIIQLQEGHTPLAFATINNPLIVSFTKISYNSPMTEENRVSQRYKEIGRVIAPEICALPGVLDDISASGCKVHYSFPIVLDLENEYEIKISPLHHSEQNPLNLICIPQWIKELDGNTYIGFEIQYSPDANRLNNFIQKLEEISKDQLPDIV